MDDEGLRVSCQSRCEARPYVADGQFCLAGLPRNLEALVHGLGGVDAGEVGRHPGDIGDGCFGGVGELDHAFVREGGVQELTGPSSLEDVRQGSTVQLTVIRCVRVLVSGVVNGSLLDVVDNGNRVESDDLRSNIPLLHTFLIIG